MKSVYEAASSLDAHMILNMLQQAGIEGRVDGEYLQGGVGELQAMGIVRVMVDETDYEQARSIIIDWEAQERDTIVPTKTTKSGIAGALFIGIFIGASLAVWYLMTPRLVNGIDYNNDGFLDEKSNFNGAVLGRTEIDRNGDRKYDLVYSYDRYSNADGSESDEDFNGSMETKTEIKNGNVLWSTSDTNGDGFHDYRIDFENGVVQKVTFYSSDTRMPIKIQMFDGFKLIADEMDTDADGVMDRVRKFDELEELIQ